LQLLTVCNKRKRKACAHVPSR